MTMNSSDHPPELPPIPAERDVAEFMKLHLDTAEQRGEHPYNTNEYVYSVDGKPRPMLVIRVFPKRERERRWFLVLPITKKGCDAKGNRRTEFVAIGKLSESGPDSYVEMAPQKLPENLLHRRHGRTRIESPCDRIAFDGAVKQLIILLLQGLQR